MRTNKIFYGAIGLMTLGLAACSNDDVLKGYEIETVDADQTRYISVQISAPNDATRADFEDGTTNESYVERIDFFFYDAAGNPTAQPKTMNESELNGKFDKFEDQSISRIYTSVVPIEMIQGQNLPSQVICIINGNQANIEKLKTKSLADLIDEERDYFRQGNYFVMTNSVYYGQDVLTGQSNQRLCATPINNNTQLFATEQEAEDAITNQETNPGALVDIYVERMAAKVGLVMSKGAPEAYKLANGDTDDTTDEIEITFKASYWGVNATSVNTYLTKRYGVESDGVINLLPTYDEINNALSAGGFTTWNDEPNHRSYWGCSPSYFENKFPYVSDDLINPETKENYKSLKYWTYSEMVSQAARTDDSAGEYGIAKQALAADADGGFSTSNTGDHTTGFIYTRESTVARPIIRNIESGNPAAAVASAIIVGTYTPAGATEPKTFYVDRNASNTKGTYYGSEASAKNALGKRQFIVFTDDQGDDEASASVFSLMHPSLETIKEAKVNVASRLVTLQLTEKNLTDAAAADINLFYYDATVVKDDGETGAYVPVTADNLAKVNSQLLSIGYLDMYNNGLAFFSVPIRHLNWDDANYTYNANTGVGTYDWSKMNSGSLGIVRNHVYNLTINKIVGLGSAISDPNQPIVPPKETFNQYVAARINILAWRVAKTWNVSL